jgi:hypothetical protein
MAGQRVPVTRKLTAGQAEYTGPERRVQFRNLRRLIEVAAPVQKAALRWSARELGKLKPAGQDDLAVLDDAIGRNEAGNGESERIRNHPRIRKVFSSSTPQQRLALLWFAAKLPPDQLSCLDSSIGRTELVLTRTKPSPSPEQNVYWVPEPGLPRQPHRTR